MKKPAHLNLKETNLQEKRTKAPSLPFEKRKQQYAELKQLRQTLKEKKREHEEKMKKERQRLQEKKKLKEINDLKTGKFDIIKNPQKIRKWKAKARRMIQKVPAEIFYEAVNKK